MTRLLLLPFLLVATAKFAVAESPDQPPITRIWLSHKSSDPGKIVVNWMSDAPGDSVVRYGLTDKYGQTVRSDGNATLHHVEIPLAKRNAVYHYSVSTGKQRSADATFKANPSDVLRVVVAADWQRKPDLSAVLKDDPHLLVTAGDQINCVWQACGPGKKDCVKPYAALIDRYPALFRSIPFMPALGNHDREIHPRGDKPPTKPVYDVEATVFRRFFTTSRTPASAIRQTGNGTGYSARVRCVSLALDITRSGLRLMAFLTTTHP